MYTITQLLQIPWQHPAGFSCACRLVEKPKECCPDLSQTSTELISTESLAVKESCIKDEMRGQNMWLPYQSWQLIQVQTGQTASDTLLAQSF